MFANWSSRVTPANDTWSTRLWCPSVTRDPSSTGWQRELNAARHIELGGGGCAIAQAPMSAMTVSFRLVDPVETDHAGAADVRTDERHQHVHGCSDERRVHRPTEKDGPEWEVHLRTRWRYRSRY